MSGTSKGFSYLALGLSGLALLVSLFIYSARSGGGPIARASPTGPTRVSLAMAVATFSGQGVFAHRWYPTMIVVRQHDTVDLALINPDQVSHQFELTGYDEKTKVLRPGETDRLTFVADRNGVFEYHCALPYDPVKRHCTPDHEQMRGYLIVTAE